MARDEVLVSSENESNICRNAGEPGERLFQRGVTAMAMERFANVGDEVTEGRSSFRVEKERV